MWTKQNLSALNNIPGTCCVTSMLFESVTHGCLYNQCLIYFTEAYIILKDIQNNSFSKQLREVRVRVKHYCSTVFTARSRQFELIFAVVVSKLYVHYIYTSDSIAVIRVRTLWPSCTSILTNFEPRTVNIIYTN